MWQPLPLNGSQVIFIVLISQISSNFDHKLTGGGIRTYTRFDPVRLIQILSGYGYLVYFAKFLFLIFILYFFLREVKYCIKLNKSFAFSEYF